MKAPSLTSTEGLVPRIGEKGFLLEELTWPEAEKVLRIDTVIVIPIGAACKEHGPHLKLKNDWLLAEYFKKRILKSAEVVIGPTVNCHYYPAFTEYPGSISLRLETARDLVVDICRSLSRPGPRKFYALNTGISTTRPLEESAKILANEGIELKYTDLPRLIKLVEKKVKKEEEGSHAGEIETSMMLFIDPTTVDMGKAVKDYHPSTQGGLTRDPHGDGSFSASGIYGDATLASSQKGKLAVETILDGMLQEIESLRSSQGR
jgi:creatinine amidohydrolase